MQSAQIFTENINLQCLHHIGKSELKNTFSGCSTSSKNNFLGNIFVTLKPILSPKVDIREEQKSRMLKLIFNIHCKYVILFWIAFWQGTQPDIMFSKGENQKNSKNEVYLKSSVCNDNLKIKISHIHLQDQISRKMFLTKSLEQQTL